MLQKYNVSRIILFLAIMLPNIIFIISRFYYELDRPLFNYDYLLVYLLMAFNIPYFFSFALFIIIILVDLATLFSKIYLFKLPEFLNSLFFYNNYSINEHQMAFLLILIIYLFTLFFIFKSFKNKIGTDRTSIIHFIFILFFTFTVDLINGSSLFKSYIFTTKFYKGNFAGSPTPALYDLINDKNAFIINKPILNKKSITYKQFVMDTSTNQMLILVESMGLIDDTIKRNAFQENISDVFKQYNWKTIWGQTRFTGGTTNAELRELLDCVGSYQYFINQKNAQNFISIFQIKKQKGYKITAIHSYKGNMFKRYIWWKNIGVDDVYFREDLQKLSNYKLKLNYDTPFTSVNDEDVFDFIQAKTSKKSKKFVYFLTENGHLPFISNFEKPFSSRLFDIQKEASISEEAKNQHKRISNFLVYVASHLDSNKFQKILIVGDHMPPFLNKDDRNFYNNQFVPYCIVTK